MQCVRHKYEELKEKYLNGYRTAEGAFFNKIFEWLYSHVVIEKCTSGVLMKYMDAESQYSNNPIMVNTIYHIMEFLDSSKFLFGNWNMCTKIVLMTTKFYDRLLKDGFNIGPISANSKIQLELYGKSYSTSNKIYLDDVFKYVKEKLSNNAFIAKWCNLNTDYTQHLRSCIANFLETKNGLSDIYRASIIVKEVSSDSIEIEFLNIPTFRENLRSFTWSCPRAQSPYFRSSRVDRNYTTIPTTRGIRTYFKTVDKSIIEKIYNLIFHAFRTYIFYGLKSETEKKHQIYNFKLTNELHVE